MKKEKEVYKSEMEKSTSLFHRNIKGEVVFNEIEAERASDFIASTELGERVKASLQKKRFVLPQQTDKAQAFFCNESVYGTLNVLWVSGVIRMDNQSAKSEFTLEEGQPFDAWPSKEGLAMSKNNKNRIERLLEENAGISYWNWPGYQG